jgi:hypothetical protein
LILSNKKEAQAMYTIFTRKPRDLEEVEQNMQYTHLKEWVDITEKIELTPDQYDDFWSNPTCGDYPFLEGKGGYRSGQRTALLLINEDRRPIVVDPSGYAYGRYVGF